VSSVAIISYDWDADESDSGVIGSSDGADQTQITVLRCSHQDVKLVLSFSCSLGWIAGPVEDESETVWWPVSGCGLHFAGDFLRVFLAMSFCPYCNVQVFITEAVVKPEIKFVLWIVEAKVFCNHILK